VFFAPSGTLGVTIHAVICGCGHNIRMILAHPTTLRAEIRATLMAIFRMTTANAGSKYVISERIAA
jgi:IS5 family transposase